ncbi:acetyltransferase [Solimicrobium silvestre]|uniref:Bacterial transferase hexapeptide (Six repeats) n=1 Tax=Solimicrobium silvestre TaxID=2099400 RepID=A0A2S9GUU9_9BURK|nr:acetyltransferase [Solimicrobium silvestre]PRC91481.1 Bacterial transferase hexapeptide (six repeats) [Solimicrobium silvestre]
MTQKYKPKIILLGGGGHCAACIDVIEQEGKFEIAGIIDNEASPEFVCGYPRLGDDNILGSLPSSVEYALITVGQINSPAIRIRLFELTNSLGFTHPTIISPRAYVSKHAVIGKGTIVMHDALINVRASVGSNCIINSKALIEHDAVIEDNCHISTAAVVNGGARIRRGSFLGSNAATTELAISLENAFVKAGTLFRGISND